MSAYNARAQRLKNALLESGAKIPLSEYKLRLMAGLTRDYDSLRDFLCVSMKDVAFTPAMLMARLITKEQQLRAQERGKGVPDANGLPMDSGKPPREGPRGGAGKKGKYC